MAIADHYKPGKRQMVMKATTNPDFTSVEVGGRKMDFNGKNYFYVKDKKVADEIQAKYKHNVAMGPVEFAEAGHKYKFGYSPSYAEAYDRIFGEKNNGKEKVQTKKTGGKTPGTRRRIGDRAADRGTEAGDGQGG